jgi:MoxR-like ATPase
MSDVHAAIATVISGKAEEIDLALTVLLAEGHLLVEDVPGVGKTMLAKSLGKAISAAVKRIQFTPDLLPTDITGVSVFNQHTQDFEFKPGGIFAQIVVGDEVNRASPKTQSALLESMEERQVSVDGVTHRLPAPFMVVATQNPVEMEGTFPRPEAQRDRFMARISLGYPSRSAEVAMLDAHGSVNPLDALAPVTDAATVSTFIATVTGVYVAPSIKDYVVRIVEATRHTAELRLGASPRASLHLLRASRAAAALAGRDFVIPDDVSRLAPVVLGHRLLPATQTRIARRDPSDVIASIVKSTHIPTGR